MLKAEKAYTYPIEFTEVVSLPFFFCFFCQYDSNQSKQFGQVVSPNGWSPVIFGGSSSKETHQGRDAMPFSPEDGIMKSQSRSRSRSTKSEEDASRNDETTKRTQPTPHAGGCDGLKSHSYGAEELQVGF